MTTTEPRSAIHAPIVETARWQRGLKCRGCGRSQRTAFRAHCECGWQYFTATRQLAEAAAGKHFGSSVDDLLGVPPVSDLEQARQAGYEKGYAHALSLARTQIKKIRRARRS